MNMRVNSEKVTEWDRLLTVLIVDALQGAARLGVSERSYHELRKRPDFPRPVDIFGSARPRWRTKDLDEWVANLATIEGPFEEPRQLAARRNGGRARTAKARVIDSCGVQR